MAHLNPLHLEKLFNDLLHQITTANSERVQLELISFFISNIVDAGSQAESYLVQVLDKLPELKNPLLYAGLHPKILEEIIFKVESCAKRLPSDFENGGVQSRILEYKKALSQICQWVGEDYSGFDLENKMEVSVENKRKEFPGEVLIPVVEKAGEQLAGRLRKMKVEIIGKSEAAFELRPTFGVIGADASGFLVAPKNAAGNLLRESRNDKNKYWKGTASFEMNHAWHAGSSANLALSSAYYCEMLKAEEQAEYFQLNPAVCITGDVDSFGNVLPVNETSLHPKTEAAFFSWAHALVVPVSQLGVVLSKVEELQVSFPNRFLPVVGVNHLRELFFDRRVTIHHKTGAIAHKLKRAWKRRYSVASITFVLVLLLIIGRLVFGPLDRNPVAIEYGGTTISLVNKSGNSLKDIQVSSKFIEYLGIEKARSKYLFTDIDGDGINEFIYGTHSSYEKAVTDTLICLSVLEDKVLWRTPINLDLDYSHRPDLVSNRWSVVEIEELVDEKREYFIAGFQYFTFYPSVISKVSKRTGEIESFYVSPGNTFQILTEDINEDGIDEVLLLSGNNSYWGTALNIISSQELSGHAPSGIEHRARNVKDGNEIGYVLLPSTIIGRTYTKSKGTEGRLMSYNKEKKQIMVQVYDARIRSPNIDATENPMMIYTFDDSLKVEAIGSGDIWDILAKEYYEKGILNFKPGIEYLNAFKDSLLWWNGDEFVNEPTLSGTYDVKSGG